MVKYCQECGAANLDEAKFCIHCGTAITRKTSEEADKEGIMGILSGKNRNKWIAGIVLVLLGTMLIIYSLLGGWYTYKLEAGNVLMSADAVVSLDLRNIEIKMGESTAETSWSDTDTELKDVFKYTLYVIVIASIFALVLLALTLFGAYSKIIRHKKSILLLGTIIILLSLIASLYVAISLPDKWSGLETEMSDEFDNGPWNSFYGDSSYMEDSNIYSSEWGPSYGWYAAIIGGILCISGSAILSKIEEDNKKYPQSVNPT